MTKDLPIDNFYRKQPVTIERSATIGEALHKMDDKSINGLVVVDKQHAVVGILSVQDIAAAIVPIEMQENTSLAEAMYRLGYFEEVAHKLGRKKVTEIMRTDFKTVSRDSSIMEIAADFLHNDLYIVPVVEDNKLLGVVTRTEIRKALKQPLSNKF